MEQTISTGLQMMQIDLSIDAESLCVIRALNTITFDDLHKIICHKISVSPSTSYIFYLPKSEFTFRRVAHSFDHSAMEKIASYIQTGDTIYYRIFRYEFHLRFSSMGIVDEATAMDAKLLVTQSKIKNMIKKENMMNRNSLTRQTAHDLYQICDQLFEHSIFHYFQNQTFLMLHIDNMLQPIYIENQQSQFLLYFFQDEESYRRFFCVYKDTLPNHSIYKYKQATVLRFSKKPLASFKCHRYLDTYISFLDMRRGWEMDGIQEDVGKEMKFILPIVQQSLIWLQEHPIRPLTKFEMLHIYGQQNQVKIEIKKMDAMVIPVVPYDKPQNIEPLLEMKKIDTHLEMDYRFVRQPYKGAKNERLPYLLNVSALGPHIQSHFEHTFEKETDIRHAFQDMLINIIEENGKPNMIKVKDRYIFSILDDLCSQLQIFIQIEPRLPYIDAYYADDNRVIYDMELVEKEPINADENTVTNEKKAVVEQPLQHQYNRKRFKMKGYFN